MARGPDLRHLAGAGRTVALRVTPKAAADRIIETDTGLRVYVTVVPEDDKANAAVIKLLAKALGVPKSRLRIVQGGKSRDKVVAID